MCSALDSTDSDNVNLKNKAESLINDKANKFFN